MRFVTTVLAMLGVAAGAMAQSDASTPGSDSQPSGRSPQDGGWRDAVEKASTHRRFAVRRSIANKIARAGAEAVPALRAFEAERGRNGLDLLIVDSIARAGTDDDPVVELLANWADDNEFYWRSQALDGLAARGLESMRERFERALADQSHLFRIAGARGLIGIDDLDAAATRLLDHDPRARVRVARALALAGDDRGLPELVRAIAERRDLAFLDDPWGHRDADLAAKTIREIAGEDGPDFGWRRAEASEKSGVAKQIARWVADRTGTPTTVRHPRQRSPEGVLGGAEIRSCRNGDLFVRWTRDAILVGLDQVKRFELDDADAASLRRSILGAGIPDGVRGKVVCDFLRLRDTSVEKHAKFAPQCLPAQVAVWLNHLAQAVENVGGATPASGLRARLPQFERATEQSGSPHSTSK